DVAMRKALQQDALQLLEAAGLENVHGHDSMPPPGHCIHELGTARMGKDPKTSALNKWNQVLAVQSVFVTDGTCIASSACLALSLTNMALTARAADYAVKEGKKGNI